MLCANLLQSHNQEIPLLADKESEEIPGQDK